MYSHVPLEMEFHHPKHSTRSQKRCILPHIVLHTAACNVAASAVAVVAFAAGAAVVFSSCNPVNIVCGSSLNWVSAFPAGHQVVAAAVAQMAVDTGESYYFADMVGEDVEDGWLDWDHIDSAQEGKHNL